MYAQIREIQNRRRRGEFAKQGAIGLGRRVLLLLAHKNHLSAPVERAQGQKRLVNDPEFVRCNEDHACAEFADNIEERKPFSQWRQQTSSSLYQDVLPLFRMTSDVRENALNRDFSTVFPRRDKRSERLTKIEWVDLVHTQRVVLH